MTKTAEKTYLNNKKLNTILITWFMVSLTSSYSQELTKKEVILADSLEFSYDVLKLVRLHTVAEFRGIQKDDRYEYPALVLNLEHKKTSLDSSNKD